MSDDKITEEDVLRWQLAETQVELARTRMLVADQEFGKVVAFTVQKYKLDEDAGDKIDFEKRAIVRGPK
jgi:hypothetical protein